MTKKNMKKGETTTINTLALETFSGRAFFMSLVCGVLLGRLVDGDPILSALEGTPGDRAQTVLELVGVMVETMLESMPDEEASAIRQTYMQQVMRAESMQITAMFLPKELWAEGVAAVNEDRRGVIR